MATSSRQEALLDDPLAAERHPPPGHRPLLGFGFPVRSPVEPPGRTQYRRHGHNTRSPQARRPPPAAACGSAGLALALVGARSA
jgi:hypothetical protein